MSQTVRVRYSAGGWLGLVRGRCLVALPADASEETAAVVWDLLSGTPGVERLLATVLSGRLDLTGLPSFAIVAFREGTAVHAILRGEVSLRMTTTAGGLTELTGTGVATWNERLSRDIGSFELLVEDAGSDVENLPLESGAVRLRSVHVDLGAESPEGVAETTSTEQAAGVPVEALVGAPVPSAHEAVVESEPEPEPEPEPVSVPEPEPDAASEPEPEAEAETEASVEAGPEVENVDPEPAVDNVTDQDATIVPEAAQLEPASLAESAGTEGAHANGEGDSVDADTDPDAEDDVDDQTIASAPSHVPSSTPSPVPSDAPSGPEAAAEQPARAAGTVPGPQELIDSVPWLAAARKAVPSPAPEASAEMVEVPADLNMTVAPAPHLEDEQGAEPTGVEDADDADTVLSPSVPGTAPVPEPTASPAGPASGTDVPGTPVPAGEDHDGETVMKSDLDPADLPAEAPAPTPAPPATGPVVLARQCSQGHANPPTSAKCGICGQSLSGEAQQVRRPSLGRIRMSTGEVVELDRPAVVGRQPQAHRVGSGMMPRMVQVRSPNGDISRSHVEVVLEGWHVQLRDLKATNGTVLIREGQPPRRLGQGESLMVLDGDIADLGDGVSLRFEGLL